MPELEIRELTEAEKALADAEVLGFLRTQGERARYVTSVCTGSLLLDPTDIDISTATSTVSMTLAANTFTDVTTTLKVDTAPEGRVVILDANKDGKISTEELQAIVAWFAAQK